MKSRNRERELQRGANRERKCITERDTAKKKRERERYGYPERG